MNKKIALLISIISFFIFHTELIAQVQEQTKQLRILIWSELDAFPGVFEQTEKQKEKKESSIKSEEQENQNISKEQDMFKKIFGFSIERTKQIAPFLLNGMINGWQFEYTPYDKRRKVQEYWSFEEIKPFDIKTNPIEFHDPEAMDNKLISRVYCNRTEQQQIEYKRWCSIVHPHIKGIGRASIENGFDGIKEACSMALRDAVRAYWRTLEKNKPKEISGTVLLIRDPRIYIRNGQYVVDLDFFLETDRIIKYTQF